MWPRCGVPMVTSPSIGAPGCGVLCDETSHRMSDYHDGVVGPIQFVDQLDEALRRGSDWPEANRSSKYLVRQPCSRALRRIGVSGHSLPGAAKPPTKTRTLLIVQHSEQ